MEGTSQGSSRSKLGMDIFLSQCKGFHGRIKTFPEDFLVTELDLCGKPVRLQSEGAAATSSLNDNPTVLRQSEERIPGAELDKKDLNSSSRTEEHPSACTSSVDEPLIFDEFADFDEMTATLEKIVGQEAMDGLKTFSKREFERNDQVCSSIMSTTSDCQALNSNVSSAESPRGDCASGDSLSLGGIPGKEERTFAHKAVQCLHPHLKTSAIKEAGDTTHALQVFTNPVYWAFRTLLASHQTESIIHFACSKFSTRTISVGSGLTKKQRTSLHGMISTHFGKFLESKTCERDGRQEVVIRFRERYSKMGVARGVKRKADSSDEPGSSPIYTGFTLKKENLETLDALQQLGRVLKVQTSAFSYAGIKDKKAVTLQSVAVKGLNQTRFNQLICDGRIRGITTGNVRPLDKAINPGDLSGNLFDILIRDVHIHGSGQHQQEDDEALLWQELDSCFKCMQERGFVNYFGEQRFGPSCSGESQSAAIGLAILAGNYRKAIDLILGPDGERNDSTNNAKRHFQKTLNAKEALALMPKYKTRECIILKALHRHGLDRDGCMRALFCIPHGMRQFYIHAFCSLAWNHMASERLRLYGCKVAAGDLVLIGNDKQGTRDKIQEVTEDDVKNGVFSIQDVALPLPGNSIRYPGNRIGGAYKKYMEEVDLGSCMYRVTDLQVNIPGDYRRLIGQAKDLHWQLEKGESSGHLERSDRDISYPDRAKNEAQSRDDESCFDVDSITNKYPTLQSDLNSSSHASESDNPQNISENLPITDSPPLQIQPDLSKEPGSHVTANIRNLRVKFKLPSSTYATVFLRGLMKR